LQAHGVEITKPPTYNERYQIYHLFARDPNGYLVEIQRFEDPRWGG
jgi:catechol 2,3-dioxygenase-like lactoylglutathione lyase family enzyme